MPFADPEKNRAARRDWNRRHPELMRAAKRRSRARQALRNAATRIVRPLDGPAPVTWSTATPEQRRQLRKLIRCGTPRVQAQAIAYGGGE